MQDAYLKVKQKITGALVHGLGYFLFRFVLVNQMYIVSINLSLNHTLVRSLPWIATGANLFLTIFLILWNTVIFLKCVELFLQIALQVAAYR